MNPVRKNLHWRHRLERSCEQAIYEDHIPNKEVTSLDRIPK
jgi:hypothetical protein